MFVIESDATVVAPLMLSALLECVSDPDGANNMIAKLLPKARDEQTAGVRP